MSLAPLRAPSRRDLALAFVGAALAMLLLGPLCGTSLLRELEVPWLELTPGPLPRALRLASAAGLPVGLWILWRRLQDPTDDLSEDERHLLQGATGLLTSVGGLLVTGGGDAWGALLSSRGAQVPALGTGLFASALAGWWLLLPGGPRGAWRGAVCYGRSLVYAVGAGLGGGILLFVPAALLCKLLGWDPPPAWMQPWFQVVVPTTLLGMCVAGSWVAAKEAEQSPEPGDRAASP